MSSSTNPTVYSESVPPPEPIFPSISDQSSEIASPSCSELPPPPEPPSENAPSTVSELLRESEPKKKVRKRKIGIPDLLNK